MKIHTLAVGAYETNCYILYTEDSSECLVIDPGYEPETVLNTVHKPHQIRRGAVNGVRLTEIREYF